MRFNPLQLIELAKIEYLVHVYWGASRQNFLKSIHLFSETEADTVWQLVHGIEKVDDPTHRAQVFRQIIEEDFHAEEFKGICERAPESLARRIAAIPGVAAVETRVVADVLLDVPGLAEPASGRLVSIPERAQPALNRLELRSGRWVAPGRAGVFQ